MKFAIHIRNDNGLVKVKGPYSSRVYAKYALNKTIAAGWIPNNFKTEIVEWDTDIPSMRDPAENKPND